MNIFWNDQKTMGLQSYQFNRLGKVNGEHSLIMLVYNIKRCINILGVPDLIAKLLNGTHPIDKSLALTKTTNLNCMQTFLC
jgi:hypothetical protein